MAKFKLLMPKLGESVQEATIITWFKKAGDKVEEDEPILEIATDKVDSEIPSPVDGVIEKTFFEVNDIVPVGEVIAIINLDGEVSEPDPIEEKEDQNKTKETRSETEKADIDESQSTRFYSPLVKKIAKVENISMTQLEQIEGTGSGGRVRKQDVLKYLENLKDGKESVATETPRMQTPKIQEQKIQSAPVSISRGDQVVEMDRMRRMIADHMVMSKHVSAHVCNFIEVDVTSLVMWRNKIKDDFYVSEKTKLSFMPLFIEATAQALKEFPGVNASVDGYNIILRKDINIGIAVALPTNNLIVPVIKNADQKNLRGLAHAVNDLADQARSNNLSPDDIQGGTFTISNFGTFRNMAGTPVINQPQVAILATGNIEKKPAVIETPQGDMIGIRHKMILSLSYDHRAVDGALGGAFLYRLKELLENFDIERKI